MTICEGNSEISGEVSEESSNEISSAEVTDETPEKAEKELDETPEKAGKELDETPEKNSERNIEEHEEPLDEISEEQPEKPEKTAPDELPDKELDKELSDKNETENIESHTRTLRPKTGGHWENPDEVGNSRWYPDPEVVPGDRNGTNPEHKSWGQILEEHDIDSIPFNDNEPDFSEVSKGEVQIDEFTSDRLTNFRQADIKLAEQRGCDPEDIEEWREENRYTWHECGDCRTMQLVPTEVHGNISHSGGISRKKGEGF